MGGEGRGEGEWGLVFLEGLRYTNEKDREMMKGRNIRERERERERGGEGGRGRERVRVRERERERE